MVTANEILLTGGSTFDLKGNSPANGFMVSIEGKERIFDVENFSEKDLEDYIKENETVVAGLTNAYYGAWINEGKVVLDVSINVSDKFDAIVLGMGNKQKAIFDLNNGKEIFLPEGQTSGTAYQNASYNRMKARELV